MLDPFAFRSLNPPAGSQFRLIPEPVEALPNVNRCEARAAIGIPSEGRYLAFVGGLSSGKGVELLLEAFARAKVADSDRLLFVGKYRLRFESCSIATMRLDCGGGQS